LTAAVAEEFGASPFHGVSLDASLDMVKLETLALARRTVALSRERRARKPSISHLRGAPLAGLQRRVRRPQLKRPALEEVSSSATPHHRPEVPPTHSRA
jgi:hypothetical protein